MKVQCSDLLIFFSVNFQIAPCAILEFFEIQNCVLPLRQNTLRKQIHPPEMNGFKTAILIIDKNHLSGVVNTFNVQISVQTDVAMVQSFLRLNLTFLLFNLFLNFFLLRHHQPAQSQTL